MSAERDAVLSANAAFYVAFGTGDASAMERLWARGHPVACIHPGWPLVAGRDAVLESWRGIFAGERGVEIACTGARALLLGDVAIVVCHERLPEADLIATNVFAREDAA